MKNRARKNSPDFGPQPPNRGNHPGNAFRRFCNGFLAFCNGIVKRDGDSDIAKQSRKGLAPSMEDAPCVFCNGGIANTKFGVRAEPFNGRRTAAWAANEAEVCEYAIQDTDLVCAANEGDGWYLVAPYGSFAHSVGVQRFDERGADEIIAKYKSIWERLKRAAGYGTTIPVHLGHPDVGDDGRPGISSKYLDKSVYGKVADLAKSPEGLLARIDWQPDFGLLPHGLRFSPFWLMRPLSRGVYRPIFLASLGLTPTPNIPETAAANSREDGLLAETQQKEKEMVEELLKLLGYSEEEARKYLEKSEGAPSEEEIKGRIKAALDGAENAEAAKTAQAEAEEKLAEARAAAANDRAAAAEIVVNAAIKAGRLTEADRAARTEGLKKAPDFVAAANEIEALPVVVETKPETDGLKQGDAKAAAKAAFNGLVSKYESEGMSHFDATMRAKREMPEQYKLAFES